ncbi:PstS family phosphate ABC transporter substrate-binding protein [Paenibacillus eucommiae]|uniref:Phosphate transport system substrate-binding protein n=1 Tax=Paenibacillus eucommiae TaxID=1355755 RepID=A0ABS4J3T7_9BACL|nr:substrate-binding domain-containing protein [Paenibacillus eucommiae]MBP1994470.1 phosphate transport system substrate-binding protein [Paenibacillus eucommiae]
MRFYTQFVLVVAVVLAVFVVIRVFNLVKPKILYIAMGSFVLIGALTITGYEIKKAYNDSFAVVDDQAVELYAYQPFNPNTRAARLEEPASLSIPDNLPRLDGATALYPLYAAFVQAVYPEKEYDIGYSEVLCSTTIEAYEHLIQGNTDIIFAARPSQEQLDHAKTMGVELKLTPIGREAFVFFVNASNPVTNLSTEQIRSIYSGETRSWKQLGGQNEKIKAFQRPDNSGSQTMLQKIMEDRQLMTSPKEDVIIGMGQIIKDTADYRNYKNAIGYSFLYFATEMVQNGQIRLLDVDGIAPAKQTIENGEYPLAAEFYAVTAGTTNPHAEAFVEWILSPQGQLLVEKTGYTALKK